jgi:hypothetical protein
MVLLYIAAAVVLLALRFAQVRRVRYERRDALLKQYAHLVNNLDKMTYKDAEVIVRVSQHYVSHSFKFSRAYRRRRGRRRGRRRRHRAIPDMAMTMFCAMTDHQDLPFITAISLSFALFKTYAVPTISAVLCKSAQLAAAENVARRAEDTSIVIGAFVNGGLDSEQGSTALARMNFLHARYGKLITREDKLYTLSTFVYEPALFAERFDWRPLTPLEKQAR